MSKKFGSFNVNDVVVYCGEQVTISSKRKGGKTKKDNKQGGIITGFKSKPCLYELSNGITVQGNKLKKLK